MMHDRRRGRPIQLGLCGRMCCIMPFALIVLNY